MIREKSLCYHYHEQWHPGHVCKDRAINNMEAEEPVDANEKAMKPEGEKTDTYE